jgi:DNA-binding MarR family transcriptional regulator
MSCDLDSLISFNFYTGWRAVTSIYKDIYGNDVTPQNIFILELCEIDRKITMTELSKGLNLNSSAVSTLVSRMEKNGLLIRIHGKEDRRAIFVKLTQKGDELRNQIREKIDLLEQTMNNNLTPADIKKLQQIVTTLSKNSSKGQAAVC